LSKISDAISSVNQVKNGWRSDSSGKVPAQQAQIPLFKPQHHQNTKQNNLSPHNKINLTKVMIFIERQKPYKL
jgi:hypothetical protein